MSVVLAAALGMQVASLLLLRLYLGRGWLARPFPILAVAAVVYHGVTEVMLLNPGYLEWSDLRIGLDVRWCHDAALLTGFLLLMMTLVYVATVRRSSEQEPSSAETQALTFLSWRPLGILLAAMLVVSGTGKGYSSVTQFQQIGLLGQLTYQFLLVTAVLFSFALLRRFGTDKFVLVLALQVGLLATIGQRLELLTTTAMLLVLLHREKMMPSRKQLASTAVVAAIGMLAITNIRAESGRGTFYNDTGVSARLSSIASSAFRATPDEGGPSLLAQAANRLDGNAYTGQVLQQQYEDRDPPLGWGIVATSIENVIPRALLPVKSGFSVADVSPQSGPAIFYGGPSLNYLPGIIGLWLPDTGVTGLIPLMLLVAFLLARLERWTFRGGSLFRIVTLLTMTQGSMFFERGILSYLVALRGAIVYGLVLMALQRLWPRIETARSHRTSQRQHRLTSLVQ